MYLAIDMKSFYASVECVERGRDPLTTNLVVADDTRTDKTICLAVTPSLKAQGIPGRPRLFEVIQRTAQINRDRSRRLGKAFSGKSDDAAVLNAHPEYELDFITAKPRMRLYMEYSTRIYSVYLRYFSAEDIHVYSCDEVFIAIGGYLQLYGCSPHDLAMRVIREVLAETGITATAGIGTNLYLCKVAMDIVAKRMPADRDGVRIAMLDEPTYRACLWEHTPLTDFWGFGHGIAERLARLGAYNMGDICLLSEQDDEVLYRTFGVRAETIIDHAWGWEPCTIRDIRNYRPQCRSLSQGQVLQNAYPHEQAVTILREMTESLVLEMVEGGYVTDQVTLTVCFDHADVPDTYMGAWTVDHYGRAVPKPAGGTLRLQYTASTEEITAAILHLFDKKTDHALAVRKLTIAMERLVREDELPEQPMQYDLFAAADADARQARRMRERALQKAVISLKHRYGKNAVMKGLDYTDGATALERNGQVGGHKA